MILPFIDEERVLRVIETQHCDEGLTEKEKVRNSFEKELFMTYAASPRVFASPLDRHYYPDIINSHCTVLELDGYVPVFAALEAADHHDKTAVFSSIYPFCVGIQHPHPQQEKRKFQLTDSVMSVVEVDFSAYPFVSNLQSLQALARQYYGQFVQFGYPQCKIAQVTGLYTYEFGCECAPEPGKDEESIHTYMLHKDEKDRMKEVLNGMKKLAMQGVPENSYEVGSLDIGDNNIVMRLRPVYHFARRQSDGMVMPLFSHQFIYYPFCLTRPAKKLSITGGGLSVSAMGAYTMKAGDEVVYVGEKKLGSLGLRGYRGVVKEVKEKTVEVELELRVEEGVEGEASRAWVKEEDVKRQLKKEHQPLLHACLNYLFVKGEKENVIFSLNLAFSSKHLVREGLTRQQTAHKAKREVTLPARYYARLAVNAEESQEVKTEAPNVEYSPAAVEIIKEYFRRFGAVLTKNITMKGMKPVIEKSMTEEKAREIRAWVQAQVEAHAFVTQDTISATQSFRHKLQNR